MQTVKRTSLKLMTESELLDYIDDTANYAKKAVENDRLDLVALYTGYIRSATKQLRERAGR